MKKLLALGLMLALTLGAVGASAEEAADTAVRKTFFDTLYEFTGEIMKGNAYTIEAKTGVLLLMPMISERVQWNDDMSVTDTWISFPFGQSAYTHTDPDRVYNVDNVEGENIYGMRREDFGELWPAVSGGVVDIPISPQEQWQSTVESVRGAADRFIQELSDCVVRTGSQISIRVTGADLFRAVYAALLGAEDDEALGGASLAGLFGTMTASEAGQTTNRYDSVLFTADIVRSQTERGEVTSVSGTYYVDGALDTFVMDIEYAGDTRVSLFDGTLTASGQDPVAINGSYAWDTGAFTCALTTAETEGWNDEAGRYEYVPGGLTQITGHVTGDMISLRCEDHRFDETYTLNASFAEGFAMTATYNGPDGTASLNLQAFNDRLTVNGRGVYGGDASAFNFSAKGTSPDDLTCDMLIESVYFGQPFTFTLHYADGTLDIDDDGMHMTCTLTSDETTARLDMTMTYDPEAMFDDFDDFDDFYDEIPEEFIEADTDVHVTIELVIDTEAEKPTLTGTVYVDGWISGQFVIAAADPIEPEPIDESRVIWMMPDGTMIYPEDEDEPEPAEDEDEPGPSDDEPESAEPEPAGDGASDPFGAFRGRAGGAGSGHATAPATGSDADADKPAEEAA